MTLREQLILHRRGIMGTVIFHLLLAILFLCMQISRLQEHIEMVITMDTPDKEEVRHRQEAHERREEIRRRTLAARPDAWKQEPVFTSAAGRLNGLFPAMPRRFSPWPARISVKNLLVRREELHPSGALRP